MDMNIQQFKHLGGYNHNAKRLFKWLKDHESAVKVLGVSKAEKVLGIDYYELVSVFKELEMLGAGNFIVGRKGHDSRFIWKYNTQGLGKIDDQFSGGLTMFSTNLLSPVPGNAIEVLDTPKKKKNQEIEITHSFNLRQDFTVELNLPINFDYDECQRMKAWLDLLVY